jgi:hypothetical protein
VLENRPRRPRTESENTSGSVLFGAGPKWGRCRTKTVSGNGQAAQGSDTRRQDTQQGAAQ